MVDAVTHGSTAIEKVQKQAAARPFALLEHIPPVAPAAKVVHAVHDGYVTFAHESVRFTARVAGKAVALAFDVADAVKGQYPGGRPPPGPP